MLAFGLFVIGSWAFFDQQDGLIPTWWVILPVIIGLIVNPIEWFTIFLPLFVGLTTMYIIINKKTPYKLGFADIVAVPYAIFLITQTSFIPIVITALLLAFQQLAYNKLPSLIVGKKDKEGNIRFVPLIFNAYLFGLVAYVIVLAS